MNGPTSSAWLPTRRDALVAGTAALVWGGAMGAHQAARGGMRNDRFHFALIGAGGQGRGIARRALPFGDVVAIADVDDRHAEQANHQLAQGKAATFRDYRHVLDRADIDAVLIATPDHWHTKIAIDALRSGKDVYCEKPLTLTIEEGKLLCRVVRQTGRVFQVGTQQRSEPPHLFLTAVAMCHLGRLGKIRRVQAAIGGAPSGGPFPKQPVPPHLDWDRWLGQAPLVDYIPQRCHGTFRWWYEYSGGKMTDWGAHHVDIAHWLLQKTDTGPVLVEGTATHPVPLKDGYPTVDDCFNTATHFHVTCRFQDGVELVIRHDTDNGVLVEGTEGRIFVNRGRLTGEPVERLRDDPLPEDALVRLYKGKEPGNHMRNFVQCMQDRSEPISDVFSHHRALTTCHLANIAIRLGRSIRWDPVAEQIAGDEQANGWLRREQRKGYEVVDEG